jgi:hypothetical protein
LGVGLEAVLRDVGVVHAGALHFCLRWTIPTKKWIKNPFASKYLFAQFLDGGLPCIGLND